ncbi:TetR/AcrR family transcriptional regulator [Chloroflexus sp.]|uniref:TetR/AcrR family transcriptional regulator n=1 Tax=Chloroflexus sp. TaxID=1904827 RepID=UPI00404A67C0
MEQTLLPDPRISDSPTALRILDVAAQLFMQRGYRAVSINDIIQVAGITKPTLYYYFSDKEELFVQMGLRVLAAMNQPLTNLVTTDRPLNERLQAMATVLMGYEGDMRMMRHEMMEHLGEAARAKLSVAFYRYLFDPLTRVIDEAIAAGLIRSDLSSATAAMLFLSLCETFHDMAPPNPMAQWVGSVSPSLLVDLFLHGVGQHTTPNSSAGAV